MRLFTHSRNDKRKQFEDWHAWFAWYPVVADTDDNGDYCLCWLEHVRRRGVYLNLPPNKDVRIDWRYFVIDLVDLE